MESKDNNKNFPPLNPTFFDKAISYSLVIGAIFPTITILMKVLNKTRVIGKDVLKNIEPPAILMSNHVSLLDDLFLDPILFNRQFYRGYKLFPYHAPEERNFYKVPVVSWFMRTTKSVPLLRGKGPRQPGMDRLIQAVKDDGFLHIYPEGTRTRNGELGEGKAGIGRLVYESGAPVIPMYHQGMERILPIGSGIPRIGHEVRVSIGEPIYFYEELKLENKPSTWKIMTQKIMDGINQQKIILEQHFGTLTFKMSPLVKKQLGIRVRAKKNESA